MSVTIIRIKVHCHLLLLLRSMFVAVLNPQLGGSQEVRSPL